MALNARPPLPGPPGVPGASKANPPNQTLYCKNLNDQLQKEDLKRALYMLFSTYGVVLDVIALKTSRMRGQAHIVFRDVDASTQAMRALQGTQFFGKPMHIDYARSKSDTIKKLDGSYKLPEKEEPASENQNSAQLAVFGSGPAPMKAKPVNAPAPAKEQVEEKPAQEASKGVKRPREEEPEEEEEDDDEAMDVSDSD
ncbi:RNA-binding domain-containing protein [Sporormia fimetaria CBS 119925]|uniref:RNA-binding domain-containing protein n=1 Tax=Sporormia fimetaria CBS 119925 TaxID=1340428 RepID=A0A6A6V2B0_9PLEO|nr:RNA-binding domain-containing protein [Sporormia fimetaria CBS 119925]